MDSETSSALMLIRAHIMAQGSTSLSEALAVVTAALSSAPVAGVVDVCRMGEYLRMRYAEAENQAAVERLAGNDPKYMVERAVMAEIHGIQDFIRTLSVPAPAPAVEPWICVDDSLPPVGIRVLCVDMNYENYKTRNKNPFFAEYLRTDNRSDEVDYVFSDTFGNRIGVTHWMYKPEAPSLPEDYCEWCYGGKRKSTCQHCYGSGQAPGTNKGGA